MKPTRESHLAMLSGILLGRLLFADDPTDVDTTDDARDRLLRRGYGAVRYPLDTPPTYIVLKDGTRFTTSVRPSWLTDADIEDSTHDSQGRDLLAALTRAVETIRPHPEMDAMRAAVAAYYGHTDAAARDFIAWQQLVDVLADDDTMPLTEALRSDDAARRWSERQINSALNAYNQLRLPGCRLDRHLATAWLWANSPVPVHTLLEAGMPPDLFTGTDASKLATPTRYFPTFDSGYYLKMPIGRSAAVIWGTVTAKGRQQEGDQLRLKALNVGVRPHVFNEHLYHAILFYRIALSLYRHVLTLYDENLVRHFADTPYDQTAIAREAIVCEENRVVILASMKHAAHPKTTAPPDFFDIGQYGRWIDVLRTISRKDIRPVVYNLEAQLIMSRRLRDLTIAAVDALSGNGVTALQRIADEMFAGLSLNDVLLEPNYLSSTFQTIANVLAKQDDASTAAIYRQRAADTAARAQALLAETLGSGRINAV